MDIRKSAKRMMILLRGMDKAHGVYEVDGSSKATTKGRKVTGRAVTKMEPVTMQLWEKHIHGENPNDAIGIIPITENNTVYWGAIDIDVYEGLDIKATIKQFKKLLPKCVPVRTKSGGLHIYLFVKDEVPAHLMQTTLRSIAASNGYGSSEIYPKQTEIISSSGDVGGNWLNMPYYKYGDDNKRVALDDKGRPMDIEKFLDVAEANRMEPDELEQLEPPEEDEDLPGAPPCLTVLCKQGFESGTRNNGLYSLAVYLKQAYPDDWRERVEKANDKYMQPPLRSDEVQNTIRSVSKTNAYYKCTDQPIVQYCDKTVCKARAHGIGGGNFSLTLTNLTKLCTEPVLWFVDVEGSGRLELNTDDIHNQMRFQKRCIEQLNVITGRVKENVWISIVQQLLDECNIIEVDEGNKAIGMFYAHLGDFLERAQDMKEGLLSGKAYLNEKTGEYMFSMKDLVAYLDRVRFNALPKNNMVDAIRKVDGVQSRVTVKGKKLQVWCVQWTNVVTEDYDEPEIESDDPY